MVESKVKQVISRKHKIAKARPDAVMVNLVQDLPL